MPAFNTDTGIPYGSINLRHGVSPSETTIANNAGAGTLLMEMTVLSRVTGDDKYERAARRASEALFAARDGRTELMGREISSSSGVWFGSVSSVGGGIDSTIEYFIKSHSITGNVGDWERFERSARAMNTYTMKGGMLLDADIRDGHRLGVVQESLSSFYPGNLVLGGHLAEAVASNWPIQSTFKYFGVLPELFSLGDARPVRRAPSTANVLSTLSRCTCYIVQRVTLYTL
ncbi:putative Glycosyl hydrolase family 47 [Trypanosoma vivax]|nr:putative Glycosyl hydrolase family 47 [Trypanosoma vivax]